MQVIFLKNNINKYIDLIIAEVDNKIDKFIKLGSG